MSGPGAGAAAASLAAFAALIAAAVLSMGVYRLRGAHRDADTSGKGAHLFSGAGDFVLHWFMWAVSPLVGLSVRLGLTPDVYNYVGLALALAAGALLAVGQFELAGWAIVLSGVADILDGRIARLTGVASDFGDFIDSTFDRFAEAFIFVGFAFFLRHTPYGAVLAGAALAGSLIVSYARARGEVLGVLCAGGLMQRGERLLVTCLACFLDRSISWRAGWPMGTVSQAVLALLALSSFLTAVQRTVWIARRLHAPEARTR